MTLNYALHIWTPPRITDDAVKDAVWSCCVGFSETGCGFRSLQYISGGPMLACAQDKVVEKICNDAGRASSAWKKKKQRKINNWASSLATWSQSNKFICHFPVRGSWQLFVPTPILCSISILPPIDFRFLCFWGLFGDLQNRTKHPVKSENFPRSVRFPGVGRLFFFWLASNANYCFLQSGFGSRAELAFSLFSILVSVRLNLKSLSVGFHLILIKRRAPISAGQGAFFGLKLPFSPHLFYRCLCALSRDLFCSMSSSHFPSELK
jgi:hypothetical protein